MGKIKSSRRVWTEEQIKQVSSVLIQYNANLPVEIHRKIRALQHIHFFKATEFRTILLYAGIVAFKTFLPLPEYELYLKLFCAVTICSTKQYTQYFPLARTLFVEYIEGCIDLCGLDSITSNIHNLCHIVDDIERFGDLTAISAYEFENALHQMKILLKQCNKPLEQLARRLHEISSRAAPISFVNDTFPKVNCQFICDDDPNLLAFRKIEYKPNTLLSNENKNKWILLNNNAIARFEFAFLTGNKYFIRARPLNSTLRQNFFTRPFNSSYINIFLTNDDELAAQNYDLSNVKAKLFCMPYGNRFVFMPLIHTL